MREAPYAADHDALHKRAAQHPASAAAVSSARMAASRVSSPAEPAEQLAEQAGLLLVEPGRRLREVIWVL